MTKRRVEVPGRMCGGPSVTKRVIREVPGRECGGPPLNEAKTVEHLLEKELTVGRGGMGAERRDASDLSKKPTDEGLLDRGSDRQLVFAAAPPLAFFASPLSGQCEA